MKRFYQLALCFFVLCAMTCLSCNNYASSWKSNVNPPVITKMKNPYLSSVSLITAEARVYCSGTIIKNDKNKPLVVLTASHCVEHGKGIYIKTAYDDSVRIMHITKQNEDLDIAILVSNYNELRSGPHVDLARNEPLVGEEVWAIGNPSGEERVVTYGIVSKRQKSKMGVERNLLRITADIYFGNSGGGIFNKFGKLVGVADMLEMGYMSIIIIGDDGYPIQMDNIIARFPKPGGFLAVGLKDIDKVLSSK